MNAHKDETAPPASSWCWEWSFNEDVLCKVFLIEALVSWITMHSCLTCVVLSSLSHSRLALTSKKCFTSRQTMSDKNNYVCTQAGNGLDCCNAVTCAKHNYDNSQQHCSYHCLALTCTSSTVIIFTYIHMWTLQLKWITVSLSTKVTLNIANNMVSPVWVKLSMLHTIDSFPILHMRLFTLLTAFAGWPSWPCYPLISADWIIQEAYLVQPLQAGRSTLSVLL